MIGQNANRLSTFDEPELFALYWLQYFLIPVRMEFLQDLWTKGLARGGRPGHGELPLAKLIQDGYVDRDRRGDTICLSFRREAVSTEEYATLLSSGERFEWTFRSRDVCDVWARVAFVPADTGRFSRYRDGTAYPEDVLLCCRSLHVFQRWGLRAMRLTAERDLYEHGMVHGNDAEEGPRLLGEASRAALEDALSVRGDLFDDDYSADELRRRLRKLILPGGAFSDPEVAQRVYDKTVLPWRLVRILMAFVELRYDDIRRGGLVCGKREEAVLVSLAALHAFRTGADCGWALDRLEKLLPETYLTIGEANLVAVLSLWRGELAVRRPFIEQLKRRMFRFGSADVLNRAADGDFHAAVRRLSAMTDFQYRMSGDWGVFDYPLLLLLLACWAKTGSNRTGMTKAVRILEGFWQMLLGRERTWNERSWSHELMRISEDKAPCLQSASRDGLTGTALWLRSAFALVPKGRLALGKFHRNGLDELAQIEGLFQAGYKTLAADMVAEIRENPQFVGAGDGCPSVADEAARLANEISSAGGRPFLGPREFHAPWEGAFEAFVQAAAGRRAVAGGDEPVTTGRIVWCWHVCEGKERYVDRVGAVYVGQKRDGGEKASVPISEAMLLSGKYEAVFSEADFAIRSALEEGKVLCGRATDDHHAPSFALLKMFAVLPEVRFFVSPKRIVGNFLFGRPTRGRAVFGRLRTQIATDAAGGVRISADPVALPAKGKRDYVMTQDASDKDLWHVDEVTERYREMLSVLRQFSSEATLVVPKEGIERVEKMLSGLPRVAPVVWRRDGGQSAGIPRVPATVAPRVRLQYADGELTAALVVRLCESPLWTAEPEKGLPERLVVRQDGRTELVVRDFAAEAKAVAGVRDALSAFDASRSETDRWTFDGVIESLDALAALKVASESGGFALEWPEGKPLQLASLVSHGAAFSGGETADYWLSVSGSFKLDDGKVLSFVDLLRNFDSREGAYVKLTDDRYLKLTAALARRVEALKGAGVAKGDAFLISPAALPSLEKSARETEADDVLPLPEIVKARLDRIRDAFAEPVRPPEGFKCQMRPYQVDGYEWLSRLASCGIGACLADDMGLGKTIQLIALLLARRKGGTSLVVAPASVVFNWRAEFERFAPALRVTAVGQNPNADEDDLAAITRDCDVVVTSYGVLTSREEKFAALKWNVVVLDEAQAIKNHLTQRSKCVRALTAKFRVVATGTPVENRLSELWSLFDFINPGMLGGEVAFVKNYTVRGEATPRLKRLVKPLILRRLKREVLTDLPEKEEITVPVLLGEEERHAYEATRVAALAKLKSGDPQNKLAILAELTHLRRFCCHPSLVMPSVQVSAKLETLENLLENLKNNHHRALVFSQFVDCLSIVRRRLESRGWSHQYLDGSTSKAERERAVAAFQAGEGDFFLISLKAGGTGLNLTAANYVILLDPWWNPAVENQAADRAHRIGQRLPVTVYRLIAQDTIEEKVVNLHAKKTALAEDILSSGAASLSAEAMLGLLEG